MDRVERGARRREISRAELKQRIDERGEVPFAVWDGRVRMSIEGYQDKLAVYLDGERMYLVEGELASTHILKPEPVTQRLSMLVANEHFGMSLAARLGLAVAPVSILRVPDPVLVTAKIKRKDIFAVMTERGESEIICAPSKILSIDRRLTG